MGINVVGPSVLQSPGWPPFPCLRLLQFVTGWQQESDAEAALGSLVARTEPLASVAPPASSQAGPKPGLSISHGLFLPALQVWGRMKIPPFSE